MGSGDCSEPCQVDLETISLYTQLITTQLSLQKITWKEVDLTLEHLSLPQELNSVRI